MKDLTLFAVLKITTLGEEREYKVYRHIRLSEGHFRVYHDDAMLFDIFQDEDLTWCEVMEGPTRLLKLVGAALEKELD